MAANKNAQAQFQKLMTAMGLHVPAPVPKKNPKAPAAGAAPLVVGNPKAQAAAVPATPVVGVNPNPHDLGGITTCLTNPWFEFFLLILGTCCANHFFPGNELTVSFVLLIFTMYCYNVYEVMVSLAKCLKHWMLIVFIIHVVAFFYQERHKDPWM